MRDPVTYRGLRRDNAKIVRRQTKTVLPHPSVGDVCRDLTSKMKYFQNKR